MGLGLRKKYLMSLKRPSGRLPSSYQEVEYISFSGVCYIDTGFKPSNNTKVVMDCINQSTHWLFGARDYSPQTSGFGTCTHYFSYGSTGTSFSTFVSPIRQIITQDKNKILVNGAQVSSTTAQTFTAIYNLFLFCLMQDGSVYSGTELTNQDKCFSCQIYENDVLQRDFVPCYRISDGEIGLYDVQNNVFYTNQGAGTFTKGNDVIYGYPEIGRAHVWTPVT